MGNYLLVIQNIITKKVYDYKVVDIGVTDYFHFDINLNGTEDDGEYIYYLIEDNGITHIMYNNDNLLKSRVIINATPLSNNNIPLFNNNEMLITSSTQEIEIEFNPIKKGLLIVGDYKKNNVQYKVNDGRTTYKQYNG